MSTSSSTTTTTTRRRQPNPARTKNGLECVKLFINLDALITIHARKPPAPEEKFYQMGQSNKDEMNLNWLRNVGAPKTICIDNPLAEQYKNNNSNMNNTQQNNDDSDSASAFQSTISVLYNNSKLWIRTRPFSDLFSQLVPARADCLVYSPLPRELLDSILNQLGWSNYIRSADVAPVVTNNNNNNNDHNTYHHQNLRTLPQIGVPPSSNAHLRGIILESSVSAKSCWHPLLQDQILLAPRQNAGKTLPRFVEPFGLLIVMNTLFDAINLYESSSSGVTASQCLSEINLTKFDSMKVFCPAPSTVVANSNSSLLASHNTSTSNASNSHVITNENTALESVNYTLLNDKVRMIVCGGGGHSVSSPKNEDTNLWLYVGKQEKNSQSREAIVPEPSANIDVVRAGYFEACQAFQMALPPVLFSVPKEELYGSSKLSSSFNTSVINEMGDTMMVNNNNNNNTNVDDQQQQDAAATGKSSSSNNKKSSSSSKPTTSKIHSVNLSSWWEWISSRSPLPSSNLQSVLAACGGEDIEQEVDKAVRFNQLTKDSHARMRKEKAEETLRNSSDQPLISLDDLHMLSPLDWVSSSSRLSSRIKEDTFFVATFLLARCLAPFSKAASWLPIKTFTQCLSFAKIDASTEFLAKVFDSNLILGDFQQKIDDKHATKARIALSASLRPGLTNFIVSSDGMYVARGGTEGVVHSRYQHSSNQHLLDFHKKSFNSTSNVRSSIRAYESFFRDSTTATDGDESVRLPMPISIETQTTGDVKTRSIGMQTIPEINNNAAPAMMFQQTQQPQQVAPPTNINNNNSSSAYPQLSPFSSGMQQPPPPQNIQQQQQQQNSYEDVPDFSDAFDTFQFGVPPTHHQNNNNKYNQALQQQQQQPPEQISGQRRSREEYNDNNNNNNNADPITGSGFKPIKPKNRLGKNKNKAGQQHNNNQQQQGSSSDDDDVYEKPPTTSSNATKVPENFFNPPPQINNSNIPSPSPARHQTQHAIPIIPAGHVNNNNNNNNNNNFFLPQRNTGGDAINNKNKNNSSSSSLLPTPMMNHGAAAAGGGGPPRPTDAEFAEVAQAGILIGALQNPGEWPALLSYAAQLDATKFGNQQRIIRMAIAHFRYFTKS